MESSDKNISLIENNKYRIITVIPLLLLSFGITVTHVIQGGPCNIVPILRVKTAQGFGLLISFIIFCGALIGTYRRLPAWSYTWCGVSLIGLVGLINILSSEPNIHIPQALELATVILILISGIVLFVISVLRDWRHSALLGMSLSSIFGIILILMAANMAGPYYLNYVTLPIGILIVTFVYYFISHSKAHLQILFLFFTFILNTIIVFVIDKIFNPIKANSESDFLRLFVLITGALIIGPVISILKDTIAKFIIPK